MNHYRALPHLALTLLLLSGASLPAQADSLRCGSSLVSEGDRKFEVLRFYTDILFLLLVTLLGK